MVFLYVQDIDVINIIYIFGEYQLSTLILKLESLHNKVTEMTNSPNHKQKSKIDNR